jgi:hypothetical protein
MADRLSALMRYVIYTTFTFTFFERTLGALVPQSINVIDPIKKEEKCLKKIPKSAL